MSGNWTLLYQQKSSGQKNIATFLFWLKRFHGVSLLRYRKEEKWERGCYSCPFEKFDFFLYMLNFIQKIISSM